MIDVVVAPENFSAYHYVLAGDLELFDRVTKEYLRSPAKVFLCSVKEVDTALKATFYYFAHELLTLFIGEGLVDPSSITELRNFDTCFTKVLVRHFKTFFLVNDDMFFRLRSCDHLLISSNESLYKTKKK